MKITLNPNSIEDYRIFLKAKSLPKFSCVGRTVEFPDEYASRLGLAAPSDVLKDFKPLASLFDYQAWIAARAVAKRKMATFVRPGLGKTLVVSEHARGALAHLPKSKAALIVTPLMVVPQFIDEIHRFYGNKMPVEHVASGDLGDWLTTGTGRLGITNWEAMRDDVPQGRLGSLALDESSMLKSQYGVWGQNSIRLGKGLNWKIAATGTPAPNDRIEYANHAVFLDQYPTMNSFLARFFVNRGETSNRWELKAHALKAFYRSLSHWSIFLNDPGVYGWKDNAGTLPPIHVHIHDVPLSDAQRKIISDVTGDLYGTNVGGITRRATLSQIAKGNYQGEAVETNKPAFIQKMVNSWAGESTIIWCKYNREQESMQRMFPNAANISGDTPYAKRIELIDGFKAGRIDKLISKPDILGFGLNLQVATRHVFSGLQDSYEEFYQAIMRSNRVGSTRPLNVHIPVTPVERPMVETVLDKASRVETDAREQERIFLEASRVAA